MSLDFSEILLAVVKNKASDLHITAGAPPMLRVRGSLVAIDGAPALTPTDTREIVYAILNNSQRQRLETDWQLDFAYSIPGVGRYRVNAHYQRNTIALAFRTINDKVRPIEELFLPEIITKLTYLPRGLILVTGGTGINPRGR